MYETTPGLGSDPLAPADERRILYEIIRTVSSSVDLERVLSAVVRLIVEGVQAQSCFVWIVDGDGGLTLRAASEQYAEAVGTTSLAPGEGFAGWVAEHGQPIFVPSDALSDPRARYFPEFEEEKYQSMVSVPLVSKDGAVFGVVGLHSIAPRTLTEDDARFVIHSASLVAGAIENARLYEATRRRVVELEQLSAISDLAARAATVEELLPAVAEAARHLLRADGVHIYATDGDERLVRRASADPTVVAPTIIAAGPADGLAALAFRNLAPRSTATAPLEVDGAVLGYLVARRTVGTFDADDREIAHTVATQAAVGMRKIQLIDGLTEKNLTKDFFADLSAGRLEGVVTRARRLGCDLSSARLAVVALPWHADERGDLERVGAVERFESELARILPGALFDGRDDRTRGLVPLVGADEAETIRRIEAALGSIPLVVGVSNPCTGPEAIATGLVEAQQAARAAPVVTDRSGVVSFDGLGPYRYLLRIAPDDAVRDRLRDALKRLVAYDQARRADLAHTLEEFLSRRGNIAATAQALYVHPNTLRQRLRRIADVTGIDTRHDDWLAIEIALKLLRLEEVVG